MIIFINMRVMQWQNESNGQWQNESDQLQWQSESNAVAK